MQQRDDIMAYVLNRRKISSVRANSERLSSSSPRTMSAKNTSFQQIHPSFESIPKFPNLFRNPRGFPAPRNAGFIHHLVEYDSRLYRALSPAWAAEMTAAGSGLLSSPRWDPPSSVEQVFEIDQYFIFIAIPGGNFNELTVSLDPDG